MSKTLTVPLLSMALLGCAGPAAGDTFSSTPGSLVGVSVSVAGSSSPLYPARDGSGRYYFEARPDCSYEVRVDNRSGERLGVALSVDGLNAISGVASARAGEPGRMYILGPWETTTVRGWRSSLDDVRRFTFVDERASYAARTGQANPKLGWIEVSVYRERRPIVLRRPEKLSEPQPRPCCGVADSGTAPAAPPASAAPYSEDARAARDRVAGAVEAMEQPKAEAGRRSYPGTGWGARESDRAVVVAFDPEPVPAERATLRYEYRSELARLGVLPRTWADRDRLSERDSGFAKPPRW
jgi:hypothetical protein